MRVFLFSTVVLFICNIQGLRAQPTPQVPSLSYEQVQELNEGEILVEVINAEVPIGDVLGIVAGTPEEVLEIITDFDNYDEFVPYMAETEILEYDGQTYLCRGVTDTPWPMDDRRWTVQAWVGEREVDGMNLLLSTWDYVPGSGNLEDTEGYWLLIPWGTDGSQTLVRYYIIADLGTWLPDFILVWATENMLPGLLEAIRERAEASR